MKLIFKQILAKERIIIFLLSSILASILTWPLLLHITTYFPNGGDNVVEAWILWYDQHALSTGRIFNQTTYFNGPQFYPMPYTIAYSDNLFLLSLVFAPLYWLTKNIVFWVNSITLCSFIVCFCTSYYVLKKIIKNMYASIIGAFVFTFNPITFAHFEPGHINLLSKYFFPLEFYFGYLFVTKPSWKNSCLFFLFFTLNALSSIYFAIFTILSLSFFFLPVWIEKLFQKNLSYFKKFLISCLSIIIFLPILLYFILPYLQFSTKESIVRTINESIYFSAQPIDFLASLPINLIYGPLVRYWDSFTPPKITGGSSFYYGHTLSLNLMPMILACLGFVYLIRSRKKVKEKSIVLGLFLVGLFSLIMMFGPFIEGEKLPYYYLYTYLPLPLLQSIRAPGRFEFLLYVPFSLIAAYGALFLFRKIKIPAVILLSIILFLLILENINLNPYTEKNDAITQLTAYKTNLLVHSLLDNKITLHYPNLDPNQEKISSNYLLWEAAFNAPIMNGNTGYLPPDLMELLRTIDITNPQDLEELKALGIKTIVIHNSLLTTPLPLEKDAKLLVYHDNNITILDMTRLQNHISYCKKSDMHYQLPSTITSTYSQSISYTVTVRNDKNCYLVNRYEDRYTEILVTINNKTYKKYLKFPLFIKPHEEAQITTIIVDYKNYFEYLPLGQFKGKIIIPQLNLKAKSAVINE